MDVADFNLSKLRFPAPRSSPQLDAPLRTEEQARADVAALDRKQPWWRWAWNRRRNASVFQRALALHIVTADPSNSLPFRRRN